MIRRFTVLCSVMALAFALPAVASATWMVVNLGSASTTGGNESGYTVPRLIPWERGGHR